MTEKQLGDYIAANFSTIFPDYIFVKREFKLPNGSKIDFYHNVAEDSHLYR